MQKMVRIRKTFSFFYNLVLHHVFLTQITVEGAQILYRADTQRFIERKRSSALNVLAPGKKSWLPTLFLIFVDKTSEKNAETSKIKTAIRVSKDMSGFTVITEKCESRE